MPISKELMAYLVKCRKANVIVYDGDEHAMEINDLCRLGKIGPQVEFTAYDGIRRKANCLLAAEQFLQKIGQYKESRNRKRDELTWSHGQSCEKFPDGTIVLYENEFIPTIFPSVAEYHT